MRLGLLVLVGVFAFSACKKDESSVVDNQEIGQEVGNAMASIDESGGSGGQLSASIFRENKKLFSRYGYEANDFNVFPKAYAASCTLANTFSGCVNNVVTRTFDNCTLGTLTFDGEVTLNWNDGATDNTCQMSTAGHSITRTPNWTMTGRRGATLTVTSVGATAQVTTLTGAESYTFSNVEGINRKFVVGNQTLFDLTTKVNQAMNISGKLRSNRTLSGGNLEVTNNLTGEVCNMVPTNVTWNTTCNCAVVGEWNGSCSTAGSVSVEITECGKATITLGGASENVSFDRCYTL